MLLLLLLYFILLDRYCLCAPRNYIKFTYYIIYLSNVCYDYNYKINKNNINNKHNKHNQHIKNKHNKHYYDNAMQYNIIQ
jgi:hypothetical protein